MDWIQWLFCACIFTLGFGMLIQAKFGNERAALWKINAMQLLCG
jgi:hypothetical protein